MMLLGFVARRPPLTPRARCGASCDARASPLAPAANAHAATARRRAAAASDARRSVVDAILLLLLLLLLLRVAISLDVDALGRSARRNAAADRPRPRSFRGGASRADTRADTAATGSGRTAATARSSRASRRSHRRVSSRCRISRTIRGRRRGGCASDEGAAAAWGRRPDAGTTGRNRAAAARRGSGSRAGRRLYG